MSSRCSSNRVGTESLRSGHSGQITSILGAERKARRMSAMVMSAETGVGGDWVNWLIECLSYGVKFSAVLQHSTGPLCTALCTSVCSVIGRRAPMNSGCELFISIHKMRSMARAGSFAQSATTVSKQGRLFILQNKSRQEKHTLCTSQHALWHCHTLQQHVLTCARILCHSRSYIPRLLHGLGVPHDVCQRSALHARLAQQVGRHSHAELACGD